MASCKAAGVPVVVSPIWISLARALWGSRGSTGVLTEAVQKGEAPTKAKLGQLRKRELQVQLQNGAVNAEGNGDQCWPINREHLRQLLRKLMDCYPTVGWNCRPSAVTCNGMATASRSLTTALTHLYFLMPIQNLFANTQA